MIHIGTFTVLHIYMSIKDVITATTTTSSIECLHTKNQMNVYEMGFFHHTSESFFFLFAFIFHLCVASKFRVKQEYAMAWMMEWDIEKVHT